MDRRILILILLVMMTIFVALFWKWRQVQGYKTVEEEKTSLKSKETPDIAPPPIPMNENYKEPPVIETIPVENTPEHSYHWVRSYSQSMMSKFQIDHAHREIFKVLHEYIVKNHIQKTDECELLYVIFSQCNTMSVAKKMDMGVYLIWKSKDQQHIDHVYETILSIASDGQENPKIRANALEILMRSNNRIYMERAQRIMDTLKEHEKIQEMEQVRQRMERIQNVLQQRASINPSTLRRAQTPPQDLRTHIPLSQEEVQVQHALLDQYRRLERRAFNAMKHKTSVYDDTQNVHNHKINETVITSAQNILSQTNHPAPLIQVEKELQTYYPHYEKYQEKISDSLQRLRTDPSRFQGGITLAQVLDKVVVIIAGSRHKEEMWKRMGEELVDMNKLCATGHLSRIVNILQGFEDVPPEFQIRMDPKDEIYANLSNYLTMQIQNSGESDMLLESMIDPENRGLFLEFIGIVLQPKLAEFQTEYETFVGPDRLKECIQISLKNYLKNEKEADAIVNTIYHTDKTR